MPGRAGFRPAALLRNPCRRPLLNAHGQRRALGSSRNRQPRGADASRRGLWLPSIVRQGGAGQLMREAFWRRAWSGGGVCRRICHCPERERGGGEGGGEGVTAPLKVAGGRRVMSATPGCTAPPRRRQRLWARPAGRPGQPPGGAKTVRRRARLTEALVDGAVDGMPRRRRAQAGAAGAAAAPVNLETHMCISRARSFSLSGGCRVHTLCRVSSRMSCGW